MTAFKRKFLLPTAASLALGLTTTLGGAFAPAALAGPGAVGHTHSKTPATKDEVLATSKKVRDQLITDGKIEASWKDIVPSDAEQKDFSGKKEWVVTFKNPNATDKAKATLYIFLALNGNYLASNFTGK
jgi:hypothetical protein